MQISLESDDGEDRLQHGLRVLYINCMRSSLGITSIEHENSCVQVYVADES